MQTGACKNCRFFSPEDDAGTCHRRPPQLNTSSGFYEFPVTSPTAWCGEFELDGSTVPTQTRSY
jgi:hypothetical protein